MGKLGLALGEEFNRTCGLGTLVPLEENLYTVCFGFII
jgi:hypothetical protein